MLEQEFVLKSNDLFYVGDSQRNSIRDQAAGLYARDTRYLNNLPVFLNGEPPERLAFTINHAAAASITSANPALMLDGDQPLLPHQVSIEKRITLDSALHIAYVLQNYSSSPLALIFGLCFAADFRDVFEVRGFRRDAHGTILRPHVHQGAIHLRYRGSDELVTGTVITLDCEPHIELRRRTIDHGESLISLLPGHDELHWEPAPEDMIGVFASFTVDLQPDERWELRIAVRPDLPEQASFTTVPVVVGQSGSDRTTITTDNPFFNRLLVRSRDDLVALMTSFPDGNLPAAGIPWYVAPFGRDSLITSLQTFHVSPRDAEGTLRVLAALQGEKFDPRTEEEPGKILHEMRYGEMARTGEVPHHPYFGAVDSTSLFVLLFAETVAWSADDALYADLLPAVRAALHWITEFGDLDGDGLIEYNSNQASSVHIRHQVWKDSHDSLHHADGRPASGNISPVEVQGYTYAAYRRLADVVSAFGDEVFAAELIAKAEQLRARFENTFWIEEDAYYAQALDGDKSPVRSISSNPGQLLFTGILSPERAQAVARRLRHPDMESGWGIRTLSSAAPTYNPMSYHNGSVWPHDNSLFAAGCYAAGEHATGDEIFEALVDAGRLSAGERLNELYCGFSRGGAATDAPVAYPSACSPQAWAAGCYPYLIRSAIGLVADIANNMLRVSPHLPPFLNEVRFQNLTVLGHTGTLSVCRTTTGYEVHTEGLPLEQI